MRKLNELVDDSDPDVSKLYLTVDSFLMCILDGFDTD